jgi:hypothetical protein
MENDIREFSSFDKNIIKNFFRDYIEDSRNSIEKKSQEMQSLISSIKEENEKNITKSN